MAWRTLTGTIQYKNANDVVSTLSGVDVTFKLVNKKDDTIYKAVSTTNSRGIASVTNNPSVWSASTTIVNVGENGRGENYSEEERYTPTSIDATEWMIEATYTGVTLTSPYSELTSASTQNKTIQFQFKGEQPPKGYNMKSFILSTYLENVAMMGSLAYIRFIRDDNSYINRNNPLTGTTDSNGYVTFDTSAYSGIAKTKVVVYNTNNYSNTIYQQNDTVTVTADTMEHRVNFKATGYYCYTIFHVKDGITNATINNFTISVVSDSGVIFTGSTTNGDLSTTLVADTTELKVEAIANNGNLYALKAINILGEPNLSVYLYVYQAEYVVTLPRVLDTTYLDGDYNLPNTKYELYNSDMTELVLSGYTEVGSAGTCTIADYDSNGNYLVFSKNHYKDTIREVIIKQDPNAMVHSNALYFAKTNDSATVLTHITLKRENKVCPTREDLKDYIDGFYNWNFGASGGTDYFVQSEKVPPSTADFYDECMEFIGDNTPIDNIPNFKKKFVSRLVDDILTPAITTTYVKGNKPTEEENEELYNYTYDSEHCYVHERSFVPVLDTGPYLTFELQESNGAYQQQQERERDRSGDRLIPTPKKGYVKLTKYGNPYTANIEYRFVDIDNISNYINNNDWDWSPYTFETELTLSAGKLLQFRRQPFESANPDRRFSKSEEDYYQYATRGGKMDVYGYVNTLLDSENPITALNQLSPTSAITDYVFFRLFKDCTNIDTERLMVNASTLGPACYKEMFMGCYGIENAPYMRSNETADTYSLAVACCQSMFYNCSSMTMAPTVYPSDGYFPNNCFAAMFRNCVSIENETFLFCPIPGNAAYLTFYSGCCASMFAGCENLKGVWGENISNITIPTYAFHQTFLNCKSLIYGLIFNDVDVIEECGCESMYENCENLCQNEYFQITMGGRVDSNACSKMFKNCYRLSGSYGMKASTIGKNAFSHAFENAGTLSNGIYVAFCSGLTTASHHSYSYMLYNANINNTPTLVLEEVPEYACEYMYSHSTVRSAIGAFDDIMSVVGDYGCQHMFDSCTGLCFSAFTRDARSGTDDENYTYFYFLEEDFNYIRLNATRLGAYCYAYMFANCTSLSNLTKYFFKYGDRYRCPKIKYNMGSTTHTLYSGRYNTAYVVEYLPLPAQEMNVGCYRGMFCGCTGLEYAISVSNATTLSEGCFAEMFMGCAFKNVYPCLTVYNTVASDFFTTIGANDHPISNVPAFKDIDTMRKHLKVLDLERGSDLYEIESGTGYGDIGDGKGFHYYGTYYVYEPKNGSLDNISTSRFTHNRFRMGLVRKKNPTRIEYCAGMRTESCLDGYKTIEQGLRWGHYEIGSKNKYGTNYNLQRKTEKMCYYNMFSNNMQLENAVNVIITNGSNATLAESCCGRMFEGCEKLFLPPQFDHSSSITTAGDACYNYMFHNCYKMLFANSSSANTLHATTVGKSSYALMYQHCHSLINSPALSATNLGENCYRGMFQFCYNLMSAPVLNAQTLSTGSYSYMFSNAASWSSNNKGYMFVKYKKIIGLYSSREDIPQEYLTQGKYCHITPLTKVFKDRTGTNNVNFSSLGVSFKHPTTTTISPQSNTYERWCTLSDEYSGWFNVSCYTNAQNSETSMVMYALMRDLTLKCTITGDDKFVNKVIFPDSGTLSNGYIITDEPDTGSCTYINGTPNSNNNFNHETRYISTTESTHSFDEEEDGHKDEHLIGLTEIRCKATNAGSTTTENWTANLECCGDEGKFYKKSGASWTTGWNGIPTGWTVDTY